MLRPLLALLSLLSLLGQAPSTPQTATDVGALSLDDLIRLLPPAGSDGTWNDEAKKYDCPPEVDELVRRFRSGTMLSDDQWRRALIWTGAIRWRDKWPVTEPFALSIQIPSWLGQSEIRMTSESKDLTPARGGGLISPTCGNCALWALDRQLYQPLGKLAPGHHSLKFQVEVERGRPRWWIKGQEDPPAGMVWRGHIFLDFEVVPTLDEAIEPVSDDKLKQALRASIGVAFTDWATGRKAMLVVDPDFSLYPLLEKTALSLDVQVVRGDEVVETKAMFPSDEDDVALTSSVSNAVHKSIAFQVTDSIPAQLEAEAADRKGWHLHVVGKSDGVLRNWDARQRFSGSFDLPLDEAILSELKRAGPNGREPWCWMLR